jgi:hypothetical protein
VKKSGITQIRVGKIPVGILDLKAIMEEMTEAYKDSPDQEVQSELLNRLGKRNYIPETAKEKYGKAFLREFKKFLGRPYDEDAPEGLEIKVLGQGCTQCDRLEQELMPVMAETGTLADIEHVRDIKEIGKYSVMDMPALIINGKVKSVGRVPTKHQLAEWLADTASQT